MIPDHNVPEALLYLWLARVEEFVYVRIRLEDAEKEFTHEDDGVELSVPDPFSVIYPLYLQTMIYLYLGEYDRYNYLCTCFDRAWSDYGKHYVRTKT